MYIINQTIYLYTSIQRIKELQTSLYIYYEYLLNSSIFDLHLQVKTIFIKINILTRINSIYFFSKVSHSKLRRS